jgi:type IV pilus assembly protein PilB
MNFIREKNVIPIRRGEKGIVLGVSDPADIFLVENVGRQIRKPLELVVVPPADIEAVCEEMSASPAEQVDDFIKDISEDSVEVVDEKEEEVADLEKIAGESPVIRYVNFMISSAVKDDVSDIHIEPCENKLRVRCRIDGILFEQHAPPLQMHAAIISRLKIMANLDIAERRLPQDGKIRATVHGRTVDLRVSTLPTTQGEKCVIRILDQRSISVGLENLGMRKEVLEGFREQILQPHGVVVVTGPTGSGKSTTLYSGLAIMDSAVLNISTVEDPVEYEVGYANQIQVHDSIGMSFAAALRSLLRQDPDVIMVGEIRDEETGRIAIQAALTGHMVLSTLHTNDAPSSITRMINIGVEPFLISAAVNGILAQRLIRRICPNCKEVVKDVPTTWSAALDACGLSADELYHGAGCDKCRDTGYKGRMGIHELLIINEEMRGIIASNPDLTELKRASREVGMKTLRQDGMIKAIEGHTTIEEVLRVAEA